MDDIGAFSVEPIDKKTLPAAVDGPAPRAPSSTAKIRRRPIGRYLLLAAAVGLMVGIPIGRDWNFPWQLGKPAQPSVTAAETPRLVREAGSVSVPEGSPYRARIAVAPVELRGVDQTRTLPAAVEANPANVFNILPPLGGRVLSLKVRLGDRVEQGQPLVDIDSADLAQAYADVDKARAQAVLTKRALERARGLNQAGGNAVKDLEGAVNDDAQAQAEVVRAERRLSTLVGSAQITGNRVLTVSSPASGTVTAQAVSQGAYINDATQTMLTVTNIDQIWVTANVPEKDIGFIRKGQDADVVFTAYPAEVLHGKVLFINDIMEPDTRRTKVRIGFANSDGRLKPNMFATVTFHAPPSQAIYVPDSALLMNNDNTTVFVETAPWTFTRRSIQPGYGTDGMTVINDGLKQGERIVIRGGVLLND